MLMITAIVALIIQKQTQHLSFLSAMQSSTHSPLMTLLKKIGNATKCIAPVVLTVLLCAAAVSYPGILNMPYLLIVLSQAVLWQQEKRRHLSRISFISSTFIYLYATLHLAFIVLCQNKILFDFMFNGNASHSWLTKLGIPVLTINNTKSASSLAFTAILFYLIIPMLVGPHYLKDQLTTRTTSDPVWAFVHIFMRIARTEYFFLFDFILIVKS